MPGIRENILSFEILSVDNPKTLVFLDTSSYMSDKQPEAPRLEITLPGYDKYFLVDIEARKVNTLNSSTIGLNQAIDQACLQDLPDGIWDIKFKVYPYKLVYICKKFMRTVKLREKLTQLYNYVNLEDTDARDFAAITEDLFRIHTLIEGAEAAAKKEVVKKAYSYYRLADELITRNLNRFCKGC